jgi:ribosomal protein S18 acetylase RimI-like enzyme
MKKFHVERIKSENQDWINKLLQKEWLSTKVVSRGKLHDASKLPGFIAFQNDKSIGLITYHIQGRNCEIVSINSLDKRIGVATELVKNVKSVAVGEECKRLWLITTNDNVDAIEFYLKSGFTLCAVHRNALIESRKLKPEIPEIGNYGIPMNDEIEFEIILDESGPNEI